MVESHSDDILADADKVDVAFLVVGDPFGSALLSRIYPKNHTYQSRATTHADLILRARLNEPPIPTRTVPNASILTGIGCTGLSLYNFGQTVSMVFFTDNWKPASYYDRIAENATLGLHTLVLLDIKVKEPDLVAMTKGKLRYEAPRFMTVAQCASQMLETETERAGSICGPDALAVGVARVGAEDQLIVAGTLTELSTADLGRPLHSLVLIGKKMHELERDFVRDFAIDKSSFDRVWSRDYSAQG